MSAGNGVAPIDVPAGLDQFVNPPDASALARGVFLYYCSLASNMVVVILAVLDENWVLFIVNLCAVILPGIMHAMNMFFVLSIVKPDMDKIQKRREAILTVFNLNKIVEVYRYMHGTPPIWSLLFKARLGALTFCALPSSTINIVNLVSGLEPGYMRTFLIFNTCLNLIFASLSARLVHSCHGPPGNMQKYRYWDIAGQPYMSVFFMLIIDFSQIYYRLVMLGLVCVFAGPVYEAALAVAMSAGIGAFARVGLQVVPAYDGVEKLMSSITAFENAIFDYPWLEPVPVYSFYIEVSYFFRIIQMIFGGVIIAGRWEKRLTFDPAMFQLFMLSGGFAAATYMLVYPFYVFYLVRDRVAASYEKRDEFMSTMLKKRFDRQTSRRFGTSSDILGALQAPVNTSPAPPLVDKVEKVEFPLPPPPEVVDACTMTVEGFGAFGVDEVKLALLDQGFDTIPVELMRNVAGEVHAKGTVSLAFSHVEHGDGIVAGVLMKKDGRYIACQKHGCEMRWADVLETGSCGTFTDDVFIDHVQKHECFKIYRINDNVRC